MAIQYGSGYDERAVRGTDKRSNGTLTLGNNSVPLWVFDLRVPFGLSGSTAQSFGTRSFFPRALTQPEITLDCQAPTQVHYGRTVEFIRQSQKSLSGNVKLDITAGGPQGILRGQHQAISATGYIRSVPRRHTRFEYSPEFSFAFVVAQLTSPTAWADDPVKIRQLKSWQQIVEGVMAHDQNAGFVDDPDRVQPTPNPPQKGRLPVPPILLPGGGVAQQ
jgi:hypothetical protein